MRLLNPGISLEGLKASEKQLEVSVQTQEQTTLTFILNVKGAYCKAENDCADRFMPIIEVPDSSGQVYLVDLRGLIFVNPLTMSSSLYRDSKTLTRTSAESQRLAMQTLTEGIQKIKIRFRKKRTSLSAMTVQEGEGTTKEWSYQK